MFSLREGRPANEIEIKEVHRKKIQFVKSVAPFYLFDINKEYPSHIFNHLLHSGDVLKNKRGWFSGSRPCSLFSSNMSLYGESKEDIWEDFRCGRILKLPKAFFNTFPLVHENGKSFTYIAFEEGIRALYRSPRWLRENINLFRVRELKHLGITLPKGQAFLSKLNFRDLNNLLSNKSTFLASDFYIQKIGNLKFVVYPKKIANAFFVNSGLKFRKNKYNRTCYYQENNLCWSQAKFKLRDLLSRTSLLLFLVAILIVFFMVNILYNKIKKQKQEEERKKHALRVLTHELRTPISSLLLNVEGLNKCENNLSADLQDRLLRVESDVYRLKHLANKSSAYLQADSSEIMKFNQVENQSINELIEEIVSEYETTNIVVSCSEDFAVLLDPYWFKLCVSNLIDNAIRYGKAPITITIEKNGDKFKTYIQDEGNCEVKSLKSLIRGEGKASQGLGLGLQIVKKTLKEMDGSLDFSSCPSTFIMELPCR